MDVPSHAVHQATAVIDPGLRLLDLDAAGERLFGVRAADVRDRPLYDVIAPPGLAAPYTAAVRAALATGADAFLGRPHGGTVQDAAGRQHVADVTFAPAPGAPGRFTVEIRCAGLLNEAGQARAEALLRDAQELAAIASWELEVPSWRVTWSPGMYEIGGLDPRSFEPTVDNVEEIWHPVDRPLYREAIERALNGSPREELEARILRPDGEIRLVQVTFLRDAHGDAPPVRLFGSTRDITEVRRALATSAGHRAVIEALTSWEASGDGLSGLMTRVATGLGWPAAALWVREGERLICRAFWATPGAELADFEQASRQMTFAPGEGTIGRAWSERRPAAFDPRAPTESFKRLRPAEQAGVLTDVAVPVLHGDEVLAVLELAALDRRPADTATLEGLAAVGRGLGLTLSHRRGELGPPVLTPREREVLQLAAEGGSVASIADRLTVSPATVRTHFQNLYDRLGVRDRAAAVAEGMRLGLVN
jgi:DNA-binding CsgD family transcriptional regulator/PAS domain-containing protein